MGGGGVHTVFSTDGRNPQRFFSLHLYKEKKSRKGEFILSNEDTTKASKIKTVQFWCRNYTDREGEKQKVWKQIRVYTEEQRLTQKLNYKVVIQSGKSHTEKITCEKL